MENVAFMENLCNLLDAAYGTLAHQLTRLNLYEWKEHIFCPL